MYDLRRDPGEHENVAEAQAEAAKRGGEYLDAYRERNEALGLLHSLDEEGGSLDLSPDQIDLLRRHGYLQ
jgi:hypothetical protein